MRVFYIYLILFQLSFFPVYAQQPKTGIAEAVDKLLLHSAFDEALEQIEAATGESASLLLEHKKAEALIRMGSFAEAENVLEKIQTHLALHPDSLTKALAETSRGFLQLNQGRADLAEETLRGALLSLDQMGNGNSMEAAHVLSHLGIVYMSLGKYRQAQEHMHRALSLRQSGETATDEWIAATYNDLGLVYSQTDKDKALQFFERAQNMYSARYGADHPKIAIANINTGIIYRDLEFFDDAVSKFEQALKIGESVYAQPHPAKAIALYNLGLTHLKLKNHEVAMAYYEKALKMYEDCYGPRHPEIASVLNAIGNLQVAESAFDNALASYQQSLQANVRGFDNQDVSANPPLKDFYNGARLLHTLMFKAQAYESRYMRRSLKFSDLNQALNILHRCDSLIDMLRHQTTNESDKLSLGIMANEIYSDGVRIAYEAGLNALKKSSYFEKAFYFAEKSKGAVLLESISDTEAKSFAGIPEDLLEEERKIKSALAVNAQKLEAKPSPEEETVLRENGFNLKRRHEAFVQKLEKEYPGYYNLKFNTGIPSVEQIQKLTGEKTAVISYSIDEKNNRLYIFVIRKNHFRVWKRPLTEDFEKYLTGLRNSLYFVEINTFRQCAYALARTLLPAIPSPITDLVILPAGKLSLIPFETLLLDNPEKIAEYSSLPYLVSRYNVRYEFSAGLLLQKSENNRTAVGSSIFLCAPVDFPANPHIGQLPGTETEVKEISQLFSAQNIPAKTYTHGNAHETLIKDGHLKEYGYLHFATHGLVDEARPDMSRIFLQAGPGDEDGHLFAGEIYNLELNANLVTLSACQTGVGKVFKGEGVIGLSRALAYAGARNMIVSFWNVADESTALLMTDFYRDLLERRKSGYSESLRAAKLKLLRNEKYAAPFYWAPFVLIGF